MKKLIAILAVSLAVAGSAQERLADGVAREYKSPVINPDKSVTFTLNAPEAVNVSVVGNFLPENDRVKPMTRDQYGMWTFTSEPLKPDFYSYSFIIDGATVNDPMNVYTLRDIASLSSVMLVPGGNADYYAVNDVPHGTVAKRWYQSDSLNMERRLTVYTPAGYEQSPERVYPVLYLLHGMGGDEDAWMTSGRAAQILDNMIAKGEIEPMVVVMPNGHTSNAAAPGESSRGLYRPEALTPDFYNGDMERSFPDVVRFIESNYRVRNDKAGKAIAGLSMGGFNSRNISVNYPNSFDYVGLFSPGMRPPQSTQWVFTDFDNKTKRQRDNGVKLYWIGIGKTDFLFNDVKDFRAYLDSINFPYEYHESEGGHTWTNWRDYLMIFLPKLFR